jgi:hypothetical protein
MPAIDMCSHFFHRILLNVYHVEQEWSGVGLLYLRAFWSNRVL